MARIFITGGSGFVGAHVVRRMVADGHDVTVFAPAPEPCLTEADLQHINFLSGGVEEPGALNAMIGTARPEIVIGLAAYGGSGHGLLAAAAEKESDALAVNVGGFRNLLAACERFEVGQVIWASTLAVYGGATLYPGDPVDETAQRRPETFYGLTKVLAEDVARYYREVRGLSITGLRLPVVFGPGLWYRGAATQVVNLFQAAADGGEAALEVSTSPLELMYVTDVANAFAHLVAHDGPLDLIYNLSAYAPSLHDVVAVLKDLSQSLNVTTTDVDPPLTYPLVSSQKLTDEVGFTPSFSLEQACADYVKALRSGH
jgi:UDP-glucose 4-epimerase